MTDHSGPAMGMGDARCKFEFSGKAHVSGGKPELLRSRARARVEHGYHKRCRNKLNDREESR